MNPIASLKSVTRYSLKFGATGEQVTAVQTALLRLEYKLDPVEVVAATLGQTTRQSLVDFQKAHQLHVNGDVDETTALLLLDQARRQEPKRFVYGIIRHPNGNLGLNLAVEVSDRNLRREKPLAVTVSDERGYYHCHYLPTQISKAKKGSADLVVTVLRGGQVLYTPSIDDVLFHAPELAIVNINLSIGDTFVDEYTRIVSEIRPLLEDQNVSLADLQENANVQDITFLNNETGINRSKLVRIAVAAKLTAQYEIATDFFYAIFVTNALQNASGTSVTGTRMAIGLSTNTVTLFYDIVLLSPSAVVASVRAAISANLVPSTLLNSLPNIQKQLSQYTSDANVYLQNNPLDTRVYTLLGQLFTGGVVNGVNSALQTNLYGDLGSLLNRLQQATSPSSSANTTSSSATTGSLSAKSPRSLAAKIAKLKGVKHERELSNLSEKDWKEALKHPDLPTASLNTESLEVQAKALFKLMEKKHPTTSFAAQLNRSAKAFGEHGPVISQLLKDNPEFDLAKGNITLLFKNLAQSQNPQSKPSKAVMEKLKEIQRVFKLAPTFDQTKYLLDRGIASSGAIKALGKSRFLTQFASHASHPFTEAQGQNVYHRAENIHIASGLIAGEFYSLTSSFRISALSSPLGRETLQTVSQDFPNLTTLFQLTDSCYCDDCMTVYSASAYLVDTLMFLKQRSAINTLPTSQTTFMDVTTVLFPRRGDLGNIDLNCANTNTTLPYIDIVCELLEEQVAPDPGFSVTGSFPATGRFATASIDTYPGLLTTLLGQSLNLPFTSAATVSGPDKSGNYIVRDTLVVVKLTQSPNGSALTGRQLRQTYKSSAQLAAAPDYVNLAAYDRLSQATYAFKLPFDLNHQETSAYFAQFNIRRSKLMKVLSNFTPPDPAMIDISTEELGFTAAERNLIITADPNHQNNYWNTKQSDPVKVLQQVNVFLVKSGLAYTDLQTILSLGLNETPSWLNPKNKMYLRHLDSSCDLSKKTIVDLNDNGLDRLHRFLRLYFKLKGSGWDIPTLDIAIMAMKLGGGSLDNAFFQNLADIQQLVTRIPGLAVSDCVSFYHELQLTGAVYANVFLNPSANGVIDADFLPANVIANEQAEVTSPGSGKQMNSTLTQNYLALCLGRTASDLTLLLNSLPTGSAAIISKENISIVYLRHLFALKLRISISDLMILKSLIRVDELSKPTNALTMLDGLASVRSSSLALTDLQYFLLFQGNNVATASLSDSAITTLIQTLQKDYNQAQKSNASPFLPSPSTPTENTPAALALAAKIPNFSASDNAALLSIIQNGWTQTATTPTEFILSQFEALAGTGPPIDTMAIIMAQNVLAAAALAQVDATQLQKAQMAFIEAWDTALASYFYVQDKQSSLLFTIVQQFNITQDLAEAVALATVAAAGNRTVLDILTDDIIVTSAGTLPPVSSSAFTAQFQAFRLLQVMLQFVQKMGLGTNDVKWMLQFSNQLNWMSPSDVMYEADVPNVPFSKWVKLWGAIQLLRKFPAVVNSSNLSTPFTIYGFFQLLLASGTTVSTVLQYLAQTTGWDIVMLTQLNTQLGTTLEGYMVPDAIKRLDTATSYLRTLNLNVLAGVQVIKATLLPSDAATMRNALKALYSSSMWLGVLANVMNPLRLLKRDALVNYLLQDDSTMTSTDDLNDYFLIDVEMGTDMLTSRIVQAHSTIQLFAQRCLMGLEPTCVAAQDSDPDWHQWNEWMSQFQVWVANRKVFLWPENYIVPNLRDNKSEIFVDFETAMQQGPITSAAASTGVISYLEALNGIAQLDVICTYFEEATRITHVFARTKAGDPLVYYYRQFVMEQTWTSWEKIPVSINDDHFVAFTRNGRLSIAWLQMQLESQQNQSQQLPDVTTGTIDNSKQTTAATQAGAPNQNNNAQATQTANAMQRWSIQCSVSERDLSGNWTAPSVSKTPLYVPGGGAYWPSAFLPPATDFHIFEWNTAAQVISVTFTTNTVNPSLEGDLNGAHFYAGSFSLSGCKGSPQPNELDAYRIFMNILPQFENCHLKPQAFIKDMPALGTASSPSPYALESLCSPSDFVSILKNTQGIFQTTYPMQLTSLDWWVLIAELYSNSGEQVSIDSKSRNRFFTVPLGTMLPFFHSDPTRTWVVIPKLEIQRVDDFVRGKSDSGIAQVPFTQICDIIDLAMVVLQRYLQLWDKTGDFPTVLSTMQADTDFQELEMRLVSYLRFTPRYLFRNFYHPLICSLISTANTKGIPSLMARATQLQTTTFNFQSTYGPTSLVTTPFPHEAIAFHQEDAYSSYNWELFFHIPFEVGTLLSQQQQFADAQTWYNYIFNPLGATGTGAIPNIYWNTKPFFKTSVKDYVGQRIDKILYAIAGDPGPEDQNVKALQTAVSEWRANPFSPHAIARSRTVAYQVSLVLNYIQNLLNWGDNLFGQFTMESVTLATQLYILADKLLGPQPQKVPPAIPTPPSTFNELNGMGIDVFGNALLELENLIPDLGVLPHKGKEFGLHGSATSISFASLYFAIPQNPNLPQYWTTVADRLFKIRNGMNINGVHASLALFSPPIDPGALVRALAAGVSPSSLLQSIYTPLPVYRFTYMTQKANELVSVTAALGQALLATLEKNDVEGLAQLRSDQELLVLNAVKAVKNAAIIEGNNAVQALQTSLQAAIDRYTWYTTQAATLMNATESSAMALSNVSLILDVAVTAGYILAGAVKMGVPTFSLGVAGFGGSPSANVSIGGDALGGGMDIINTALANTGRALDKQASISLQQAVFQRRQDQWTFNAAQAQDEENTINAQITTAKSHVDMLKADLNAQIASITSETATNNFLKTKYTNQQLYQWMIGQISSVYFSAYKLSYDLAKRAEQTFMFELADTSGDSFIGYGYWDSLKSGLMAAQSLQCAIKAMESAYIQRNVREFELTKNVSLLELDPFAIIALRSTGTCTIQIPEEAFDLDYPGQYLRRLRSVALSIPCIVGPNITVSAKLSLLSNRYRNTVAVNPTASGPPPVPLNGYIEFPVGGDPRFVYNVGAIQSIALSTAVNDAGVFELTFQDSRYLPFEYSGAISQWKLELPTKVRRFDYDTITDVIFHIRYTARDGGSSFQQTVESVQVENLNAMTLDTTNNISGLYQVYSLRQQFSSEWIQFLKTNSTQITLNAWNLPYFAKSHSPSITAVTWYVNASGTPTSFTVGGQSVNLTVGNGSVGSMLSGASASTSVLLGREFTLSIEASTTFKLFDIMFLVQYSLNNST